MGQQNLGLQYMSICWFYFHSGIISSLVPRFPPPLPNTHNDENKEGDSLLPFCTRHHGTDISETSICKFWCHSHAAHKVVTFSCSVLFMHETHSYKSWPVEVKRKTRLCSRWGWSVCGDRFPSLDSLEWVSCICSLYWTELVSLAAIIIR